MKRVAVIGCGKSVEGMEGWAIGHAHAKGYLDCGEPVELSGVDISEENLQAFGKRFEVPAERLFRSTAELYAAGVPDCVSVATWPALHYPMVLEALEKGVRGIACEKPLTLDVGELRDIERRVTDKGAVLVVSHQRRLDAAFAKLKEVAISGKLGIKLRARGLVGNNWDILSWTSHWFDMANFIFDANPQWVLAGMDIGSTRRYQQAVEDASVIYAQYEGDRSAVFITGPGSEISISVEGENGIARIGQGNIEIATFQGAETLQIEPLPHEGFAELLGQMIRALDGGPEPTCSLRRSAGGTEVAYAAQESARTGKRVALPVAALFAPLEVVQHPIQSGLSGKKILLYADGHFGSGGREGIADAFKDLTGQPVVVIDAESHGLTAADVSDVDAILIYHTQKVADAETQQVLKDWQNAGKPLMIVHAGLGAWPEWEEYTQWCGRVWEWGVSTHPHEPAVLQVAESDPLHFGWKSGWLPKDEVFIKLKEVAPSEVGMTAQIAEGKFPAAWRNSTRPNVGVWMPGHRQDSWTVPAMREGAARTLLSLMRASQAAIQ